MTSPAQQYAGDEEHRGLSEGPSVFADFRACYDFALDPFQVRSCAELEDGKGVLVAAPTGAGKTVVGEFAVHLALRQQRKCFYTTPIKALSNQKYTDLVRRYGPQRVGLLTGDNAINGSACVVVMTTEVLRNMIYAGSSALRGLGYVVMDEVHYLADRSRGAVWEEVIIHLPESVAVVSLSATVSNAEEFGEWLATVRGETSTIVEERRPVPLYQHVMVGRRLYDLFAEETDRSGEPAVVNPELIRVAREDWRTQRTRDRRPRRHPAQGNPAQQRSRGRAYTPSRVDVVDRLDAAALLPAIFFVFSRAGCDAAVLQCLNTGMRLTSPDEQAAIRDVVEQRCAGIPDEDLPVLDYSSWSEALTRGVAAHHAGMLPTFKEVVEELFAAGLVKVVFATETLALGINMPARSVVLEKLTKWNGENHADVTPAEYTQLTGRAGRRGIDVEGHGVVLWQPGLDPRAVAGLASTRTYPLRSSFRPSYNMAVNLVGQVGRSASRELLESSLAQFQADRAVVGMARQLHRVEESLAGYAEAVSCHLGNFWEYAALRRRLSDREAGLARQRRTDRRVAVVDALRRLAPGDVVDVPAGRWAGLAVVIDPGISSDRDGPRPLVVTADRQARRLSVVDFPVSVEPLLRMRLPRSVNPRNPQQRRDLASALRQKTSGLPARERRRGDTAAVDDEDVRRLRAAIRSHPCSGCADREDHARWAERHLRLQREADALRGRIEQRTNTIARLFDRVCEVLDDLGYLDGDKVTTEGQRLTRLYTELDLVAAECLRRGVWDQLSPPELAAVLSSLCFESRTPDDAMAPRLPQAAAQTALAQIVDIWAELDGLEREHRLAFLREPDLGFCWTAFRWASGASLDDVLYESGLAAGDFVRWIRQLLDLVDQVSDAAGEGPLRKAARQTVAALRRGVVAYSTALE